ncbi:MAG: histidinol dehydrogenase, partial [Cephaloticoccus sp.]|nr:histidinol dehydrogenase [Cephaloticoccus sp.]
MRLLNTKSKNFDAELSAFCRGAEVSSDVVDTVTAMLADVRLRGDMAVANYAARFDGVKLRSREFRVSPADMQAAVQRMTPGEKRAVREAHANIVAYNRRGLPEAWRGNNRHGAEIGEKFDPIRRVGLYVPGGQVPLVSSVLMTATLAKIAGCPEIAVFTPSDSRGRVADGLLAALHFVGVDEVYRIGGVQAIAAMAYGTESIPAVDKIFGPGNAYVCEAKRQVFGV